MKQINVVLCCLSILFLNCKEKENTDMASSGNEIWELSLMRPASNVIDEEKPLPYKESYTFEKNQTFIKSRQTRNVYVEAWGTYEIAKANSEEGIYYNLEYDHTAQIAGDCSGENTEKLFINKEGKLQNTWVACDGPYKVYNRTEK